MLKEHISNDVEVPALVTPKDVQADDVAKITKGIQVEHL